MGMVVFFPWLAVENVVEAEGIEVLPYRRGQEPAGNDAALQDMLDRVLRPYREDARRPVVSAAVVRLAGRGLTDELTDAELQSVFTFAELLSLCGLAGRTYFSPLDAYVNADNFEVVAQRFTDLTSGPMIGSRRRDVPQGKIWLEPDLFIAPRPLHVPPIAGRLNLNVPFLRALMKHRSSDLGRRILAATFNFNRANTDATRFPEAAEFVLLMGAFECLLESRTGKGRRLIDAFLSVWKPHLRAKPHERVNESPDCVAKCDNMSETWIHDFIVSRHAFAHGQNNSPRTPVWTNREHLLLGSYVFPLLVKQHLANAKLYDLSDDDQFDIDIFEKRAATLQPQDKYKDEKDWPWNSVWQDWWIRWRSARDNGFPEGWDKDCSAGMGSNGGD